MTYQLGMEMYRWAKDLFPICRSITGPGLRETLRYLQNIVPSMSLHEVPSGTSVFDWTIPDEWTVRSALLRNPDGEIIVDFADNNLHLVGYSVPMNCTISLDELQNHLHSSPDMPDAIPYITSYYKPNWGFCLPHDQRQALKPGDYHVEIDTELKPGSLTYGEILIPGQSEQEIFLSSYCCHPSLANNELSGPIVAIALARWLESLPHRRYSYRIVLAPETIGSLTYMSRNLSEMKSKIVGGYVITCVGDNRNYSFIPTRWGDTQTDRVARHVLKTCVESYTEFPFRNRGSDERHYCSPGADLPISVVCRTKFATYPEYHTSKDDLSVISSEGLFGGFEIMRKIILTWEHNTAFRRFVPGEPFLSQYNLYEEIPHARDDYFFLLRDIAAYADGNYDLIAIAEMNNLSLIDCIDIVDKMLSSGIIERA